MIPTSEKLPIQALVVVFATIGAFGITIGLAAPLISLILQQRGENGTMIGLLNAVPALGTLVASLYLPNLLRRLGMRRLLLSCLCIELLAFIAMPVFDSLTSWFLIRLIMGGSGAALFIASETWINTLTSNAIRGRVTAIYGMVMGISFMLGPMVIPLLGTGPVSFWVGAGCVFVAMSLVWWFRDEPPPNISGRSSFKVLSFVMIAPVVAMSVFTTAWKEVSVIGILPVYAVRSGLDESSAAMLVGMFAAGVIVFQYPIGWISDRVDRYVVLGCCAVATGLGAALLPWFIASMWVWPLIILWGGISSGLYTMPMAIVGDRFQGVELATAMACFGTLWAAGSLVGPVVSGTAMDVFSNDGFPATLAMVCAIFLVLLLVRRRSVGRRNADDTVN